MSANSSRLSRLIGPAVYVCALTLGTVALVDGLIDQLFVPIERSDPGPVSRAHAPWCTGQLLRLRAELEEAMLQELSATSQDLGLTRAEQARRRTWHIRLQQVRARCTHSDLVVNSGMGLDELAGRYTKLIDELLALRMGLAASVDNTLSHLKND